MGDSNARHDEHEQVPHVGDRNREALLALTTLGFKKPDAVAALARARERIQPDAPLEQIIRAALRECPR